MVSMTEVNSKEKGSGIEAYQDLLKAGVKSLGQDRRLSEISEKEVGRYLDDLDTLKQLVKEYADQPESFEVPHFSFSEVDENYYRVTLKKKTGSKRLPTKESKAITELDFELFLSEGLPESLEEAMRAEGMTVSPEEADRRLRKRIPREIELRLHMLRVHYDSRLRMVHINHRPGINISYSSQLGLLSEGTAYVGRIILKTDPLDEDNYTLPALQVFRDHTLSAIIKEAKRRGEVQPTPPNT